MVNVILIFIEFKYHLFIVFFIKIHLPRQNINPQKNIKQQNQFYQYVEFFFFNYLERLTLTKGRHRGPGSRSSKAGFCFGKLGISLSLPYIFLHSVFISLYLSSVWHFLIIFLHSVFMSFNCICIYLLSCIYFPYSLDCISINLLFSISLLLPYIFLHSLFISLYLSHFLIISIHFPTFCVYQLV